MQKVPFHKKGQCPSCGNEVILDGTIDVNVPVKEVEVVVPQVVAPPIQAEWLKPSYEIKAFNVTTEDLLEYIRLQIQQIIPNANVAGVSLILGDPRNYGSSGQFTELLIGISGALNSGIRYNWAQKEIMDATEDVAQNTPLNPLLSHYMFDTNYLQSYIRKGDYQKRIRLQKKLGIGEDALKKLMSDARPQIQDTINGPLILVGLDVEKIMLNLFATKTVPVPEEVQVLDSNGCPVMKDGKNVFEVKRDANGDIVYKIKRDKDGKPKYRIRYDEDGKRIPPTKDDIIYVTKKVINAEGRIKLVAITPLNEFEVQYTVYYTLAPAGPGKDDVYVKDYLERLTRSRKR